MGCKKQTHSFPFHDVGGRLKPKRLRENPGTAPSPALYLSCVRCPEDTSERDPSWHHAQTLNPFWLSEDCAKTFLFYLLHLWMYINACLLLAQHEENEERQETNISAHGLFGAHAPGLLLFTCPALCALRPADILLPRLLSLALELSDIQQTTPKPRAFLKTSNNKLSYDGNKDCIQQSTEICTVHKIKLTLKNKDFYEGKI